MFTVRKNLFKMWAWERENTCVGLLTLNRPRRDNQGHRQEDLRPSCRPPGWRVSGRHRYALYTCTQTHTPVADKTYLTDISFRWQDDKITTASTTAFIWRVVNESSCQRNDLSANWFVSCETSSYCITYLYYRPRCKRCDGPSMHISHRGDTNCSAGPQTEFFAYETLESAVICRECYIVV